MKQGEPEVLQARDRVGQTSGATHRGLTPGVSESIGNSRRTGEPGAGEQVCPYRLCLTTVLTEERRCLELPVVRSARSATLHTTSIQTVPDRPHPATGRSRFPSAGGTARVRGVPWTARAFRPRHGSASCVTASAPGRWCDEDDAPGHGGCRVNRTGNFGDRSGWMRR